MSTLHGRGRHKPSGFIPQAPAGLHRPRPRSGDSRMSEFFSMNGYGFYVWSAYGVTALVIAVELLALRGRRRAVLEEARLAQPEDSAFIGAAE